MASEGSALIYRPIEEMREMADAEIASTGRTYFRGIPEFFAELAGTKTTKSKIEIRLHDYEADYFKGGPFVRGVYEACGFDDAARLDAVTRVVAKRASPSE